MKLTSTKVEASAAEASNLDACSIRSRAIRNIVICQVQNNPLWLEKGSLTRRHHVPEPIIRQVQNVRQQLPTGSFVSPRLLVAVGLLLFDCRLIIIGIETPPPPGLFPVHVVLTMNAFHLLQIFLLWQPPKLPDFVVRDLGM